MVQALTISSIIAGLLMSKHAAIARSCCSLSTSSREIDVRWEHLFSAREQIRKEHTTFAVAVAVVAVAPLASRRRRRSRSLRQHAEAFPCGAAE